MYPIVKQTWIDYIVWHFDIIQNLPFLINCFSDGISCWLTPLLWQLHLELSLYTMVMVRILEFFQSPILKSFIEFKIFSNLIRKIIKLNFAYFNSKQYLARGSFYLGVFSVSDVLLTKIKFSLNFKQNKKNYMRKSISHSFSSTCGRNMSPYG